MKKVILVLSFLIVQLIPTPLDCSLNIKNCMCQWEPLPNGFEINANVKDIVAIGNNIFAGTYNYFGTSAVYRSTNNGDSWTSVIATLVHSLTANENRIFVATEYINVMYSDNMGSNWTGPILQDYGIRFMKTIGNRIFAAAGGGLYLSTNNGINWVQTSFSVGIPVNCIVINGNNLIVGAGPSEVPYALGGVYLSTDNGSSWILTALNDRKVTSLAVSGNYIFAGTNANGIYFSTNNGSNWTQTSLINGRIYSLAISGNNVFAGNDSGVYLSTNSGINWIQKNEGFSSTLAAGPFLFKDNYIFVGTLYSVWRRNLSEMLGINYSVSGTVRYSDNSQPVTSGMVKAFKLDKNTSNIIVLDSAIIQSNGTYTLPNVPQDSVDIGVFPNSSPPNDWVITYYPSTVYWEVATVLYPTGNLTNINVGAIRMSASTNNNFVIGKVMRLNDNPLGYLKDAVLYAKNGNTFVRCAVSDVNGIYHLQSLPAGNLKILATRLGFSRDSVSVNVSSTSSIDSINFYLNKLNVGIKQINNTVPLEYQLFQNYPNPFNPSTNIKFQIVKNGFVTIKIYDLLGKEIITLINKNLQAGTYEIPFSISQYSDCKLSSGIYFYRIQVEDLIDKSLNYIKTKSMVLVK
jgi:hypothetical protein